MTTKLGPHIINGASLALGHPPVVKLMDPSVEYVRQVRALVPDALIVVRWYEPSQPLDDPRQRAREWGLRHQWQMRAITSTPPWRVAFEGYNEIGDEQAAAYAAFECSRLEFMHTEGFRSVVGNFSVGTPDYPVWETYRKMLAAMGPGDLLGLHEYWIDEADIANRHHCARWSLVPALAGVPIVVTECGRDKLKDRGKPGWRRTCNAEQFLRDLHAYDAVLNRYPNVVGATVFTIGQVSGWKDFDCNAIWARVVAEQGTPPPEPPVMPPVVVPPPPGLDVAKLRELARALKSQLDSADDALRAAYITQAILEEMLGGGQ